MGPSEWSLLQLYQALFIGYIRYSMPALSSMGLSCVRTLESIQAQALRTCLGLPRCTSTNGTIAEARACPIAVYLLCEPLRLYLRVLTRHKQHPLSSLPATQPGCSFSRTLSRHQNILPSRFSPDCIPIIPPWVLPKPSVALLIPGITKKSSIASIGLKQLTLCHIYAEYGDTVHVYTDGSVTPYASTAAFVIPHMTVARQFKLDHRSTSTAAEIVAIREALRFLSEEPPRAWTIFCDSKPALQTIDCVLRRGPYYSMAIEIAELLDHANRNGHNIIFQWIPSHCGVIGNEQADAEAKAALNNATEVRIPFSRTDTNALLRSVIRNCTLEHWTRPDRQHKRVHKCGPEMKFRMPRKLKRSQTSMVHRIRLGVAFTQQYRHMIGCSDTSPNCEYCQVPETLEHIFCVCPAYAQERQQLVSSIAKVDKRPLSDDFLLGPWPNANSAALITRAAIAFLQATGLDARL